MALFGRLASWTTPRAASGLPCERVRSPVLHPHLDPTSSHRAVASEPTFLLRLNYVYYNGKADVNIPLGGNHIVDMEATSNALGLTAFWAPEWGMIDDKWNFAMSATLPIVNMQGFRPN